MVSIALADDHVLLRNGLANLLKELGYKIAFQADNGKQCIEKLDAKSKPDIILLDINMPEMDGYETALYFKKNHPEIKVIVLSMFDDEAGIIRMLKNGAKGYILKDCDPEQLKDAIYAVMNKGYYHSDLVSSKLIHAISNFDDKVSIKSILNLNEREITFLKYCCSEMTYKEIADKMNTSPRTIDTYRDKLFEKLNIKSRVGLVMYAIKNGLFLI